MEQLNRGMEEQENYSIYPYVYANTFVRFCSIHIHIIYIYIYIIMYIYIYIYMYMKA